MLIVVDGYLMDVPVEGAARITALDGTDAYVAPHLVTRIDSSSESGNVVHELIDGTLAATLVGDRPPTGELTLVFDNDVAMVNARAILGRPTSFTLNVPQRPALNMTFIRSGALRPGMHDQVRDLWQFTVGFQEVVA